MRIVSLCPSNTDIVLALEAAHMLVGVDRWSLGDPDLAPRLLAARDPQSIPANETAVEAAGDNPSDHNPSVDNTSSGTPTDIVDVGTDLRIDIGSITELAPDLALASLSVPGMEDNIAALDERNVPYIIVDSHDIAGVRRGIGQVADALGLSERGQALIREFDDDIEAIRTKAAAARAERIRRGEEDLLPRRVAWEWWPNPVIVVGRNSWIHDFLDILGVENVFADLDKESSPVETEAVLKRMPDTVCACWCGTLEPRMTVAKIAQRPGWNALPAVKAGRVFLLPEKLFGRPGPTLATGLHELYELFYGDREGAIERAAATAALAPDANAW